MLTKNMSHVNLNTYMRRYRKEFLPVASPDKPIVMPSLEKRNPAYCLCVLSLKKITT